MHGLTRPNELPYLWPTRLLRPDNEAQLVYLDLNHWISLARAATGHAGGGRFRDTLDLLRALCGDGRVVCPLLSTHYMEMSAIGDSRRRFDVAAVMEELSDFRCLMPRDVIMQIEFEAALDELGHETPDPHEEIELLGRGVLQAFGKRGGVRIRDRRGEDVTEHTRRGWPGGPEAFDAWAAESERLLDRSVLRGPSAEQASELRALGWDPMAARQIAEKRAGQERDQVSRFDAAPEYRRDRLRDTVAARYLALEAEPQFQRAMRVRGINKPSVFLSDIDTARMFTASLPSADAYITVMAGRHRDANRRWTANDIFDIDALSVAVPYCDVVLTDKAAAHSANATGLAARLDATVLAKLDDLVAELAL
ncbi:MAG: hypothetical protein QOF36_1878 [Microbacteriaceae bacterium]|nr:hypothetical protein [Microbacteriaceae bacterium]